MYSIKQLVLNWVLIMVICGLGLMQAGLLMYGHFMNAKYHSQAFSSVVYNELQTISTLSRIYASRSDIIAEISTNPDRVNEYLGTGDIARMGVDGVLLISSNEQIRYSYWKGKSSPIKRIETILGLHEIFETLIENTPGNVSLTGMILIGNTPYIAGAAKINESNETNILVFIKTIDEKELGHLGVLSNLHSVSIYQKDEYKEPASISDMIISFFEQRIPITTIDKVTIAYFGILPKIIWPFYIAFLVTPLFLLLIFVWCLSLLYESKSL